MFGMNKEEFDGMRAVARREFDKYIRYIKECIGPGQEYRNGLVRIVLSDRGAYYEFVDIPEEFSGAVGPYEHEFVDTETATKGLKSVVDYVKQNPTEMAQEFAISVLYGTGSEDYDYYMAGCNPQTGGMQETGLFRESELPAFYKTKWKRRAESNLFLPYNNGVVFFARNIGDLNMVVKINFGEQHGDLNQKVEDRAIN